MTFEEKYQTWVSHQHPEPPPRVRFVMSIWWEYGLLGKNGQDMDYMYWDGREERVKDKGRRRLK